MITVIKLKELLIYEISTGNFIWKVHRGFGKNMVKGKLAGRINSNGYREISINRKLYSVHRLAWLYVYGKWPDNQIDHINHVRDDNRLCNLREATCQQNKANSSLAKNNTTGYKGVRISGNKFRAYIEINGKYISLGSFLNKEDAAKSYKEAAIKYFGEFAHQV